MGRTKERDGRERRSEGEREGRREVGEGEGDGGEGIGMGGRNRTRESTRTGEGANAAACIGGRVVFILLPAAAAVSHVSYPHRHRLGCFGACHY